MRAFRAHTGFVRTVAVAVVGTFLNACTSWQSGSLEPQRPCVSH